MSRSMWKSGRHRLVNRPSCSPKFTGVDRIIGAAASLSPISSSVAARPAQLYSLPSDFAVAFTNAWTHKCEPAPILMP